MKTPRTLAQHPDVVLAIGVGLVVGMLILPIPGVAVDLALALNLAFAAIVLVAVLTSAKPLNLSTFPTLLLITTLFRLALNVSTTRMILSKGTAGEVVQAFGNFVVRGDLIVGVVMFLVITLVQFLVIGKGAERVAEVGARFTLDAMPGKQMSIDASVRSGAIEEDEGERRRNELNREAQFYGAMDGAMKFVKGDAIAGLVITSLNIVAGLLIGVTRNGMAMTDAAEVYTILTVGDGLVSQIPALLVTLAAGVLTTRVAAKDPELSLGGSLGQELLGSPKVLGLGALFAGVLGIVPGLPTAPFLAIAATLAAGAYLKHRKDNEVPTASFEENLEARVAKIKKQQAQVDQVAPAVPEIGLDIGPELSTALGLGGPGASELIDVKIPQLRDAIFGGTGVSVPAVSTVSFVPGLSTGEIVVRVKNVPVKNAVVDPELHMACESLTKLRRLGVVAKPARHPRADLEVGLVTEAQAMKLKAAGVMTLSPADVVIHHVMSVVEENLKLFVGLQETSEMLEKLGRVYPTLVSEVVPKIVSLVELTDILRRLVDERVSIRDLKTILEALADYGREDVDQVTLTELVRASLSLQLGHAYTNRSGRLPVIMLDPVIEDSIRTAITPTIGGSYVALDPDIQRAILTAIARTLRPVVEAGQCPVILTSADIRRYVRKLVEAERCLRAISVVSFQEMPTDLNIEPLGRVALMGELAAA